ncbi:MAG: L,D-transpeptidase [Rhizobiaceae bacterium]|nr:L,D-transpeptidase [Rhizobiaceae bacterium]
MAANPASSGARYATPPPAVLSADLVTPWVMQLQNPPVTRQHQGVNRQYNQKYQMKIARPVYQPRPQYQQKRVKRNIFKRATSWARRDRHAAPNVIQASIPAPQPVAIFEQKYEPQIVSYATSQKPGTIVIDTRARFLYLVMQNGEARRYGVGVGRPGFEWSGTNKITRKAEWPDWRPPAVMIKRELRENGRVIPPFVKGGPDNPLGARALYLGSTIYRIHGTGDPTTIGRAVSSGCIRMRNEDVMDLYERVGVGTKVIVS